MGILILFDIRTFKQEDKKRTKIILYYEAMPHHGRPYRP